MKQHSIWHAIFFYKKVFFLTWPYRDPSPLLKVADDDGLVDVHAVGDASHFIKYNSTFFSPE